MPPNKPNKVTLSYITKTSELSEYASFDLQKFSSDIFEDKKEQFNKCVKILLGKSDTKGRIIMLSGKSGTGKTTFLKQVLSQTLIENDKVSFIYLPIENINQINEQYFQEALRQKNGKRKVVIIEDCDPTISYNSFILNSSDGILSESYDVSYILTNTKNSIFFRENRVGLEVVFTSLSAIKAQEIAVKKNPKFNKTKIRNPLTISELMKEIEDDKS